MDSHTDSLQRVQRLEIVETDRCRRWLEDEKLRSVLESQSDDGRRQSGFVLEYDRMLVLG